MAAPTLIAAVEIDSPWAQASANIGTGVGAKAYATTLTTAAGDLIVALQGGEASADLGVLSTSDGVNTYTQRAQRNTTNFCTLNIASATDSAGGTRTVSLNRSVTTTAKRCGGIAFQFRGHGGVGNVVAATDSIQTANLTCSANSAILVICLDWNATSGTRTWANIDGSGPTQTAGVSGDGATWAAAVAYFADVGAAGSKTITLTAPTFGAATFAAIEILGAASGTIDQADYRWRNDDGSETTATWAAAQGSNP